MKDERKDLLTMSGEELFGSIIPEWGTPHTFTPRAHKGLAALRDAIVTAARQSDEAWREAVEAVRYSLTCDMLGEHLRPCENVECKTIHAVLSALLARMDGAK